MIYKFKRRQIIEKNCKYIKFSSKLYMEAQ